MFLLDGGLILQLVVGHLLVLVELAENDCLETVGDKDVIFALDEDWLQLNSSVMEQPGKISIAIFMFVVVLKLLGAFFHFPR